MPKGFQRRFWQLIGQGWSTERAAAGVGVSADTGERWFRDGGGMAPISVAKPSGRFLTLAEREYLDVRWEDGAAVREIARELSRAASTISREVKRNRLVGYPHLPPLPDGVRRRRGPVPGAQVRRRPRYRAASAQSKADQRGRRPKPSKLAGHPQLQAWVQQQLVDKQWSPEQISARLREDFPDDESMRISHEAIYQALYVQGRGALRRELTACLRTGRALRKPRRRVDERRERIKDKIMISERPAEVEDRAVPGHWEGDLIIGADSGSAIGTLVERSTRFVMLLHLPAGRTAEAVRDAMAAKILTLPEALRRSVTWDQGTEMAQHARFSVETGVAVYFCDPHSPWQRGSNENTNGLLRQYMPKGTSLRGLTERDLDAIADSLNSRPRQTLGWMTPSEKLDEVIAALTG
jgi:IS30 family transposase